MQISEIEEKVKGHQPSIIETKRANAVLIPFVETKDGVCLLFETRSETVWQPGEVCFPGGGIEAGESVEQAAVREACEELGITENTIELLGRFDTVVGLGGFIIYTCVGRINAEKLNPDPAEVAGYFTVPLSWLQSHEPVCYSFPTNPDIPADFDFSVFGVKGRYKWRPNTNTVYVWKYEDHYIWGLTAKILKNFIKFLKEQE